MVLISRRQFLQYAAATSYCAALASCGSSGRMGAGTTGLAPPPAMTIDALLSDTQLRTFRYFWETTEAARGLAPDLAPEASPASIAAMGFALTAIPIGIEHGWITRAQGIERVLNTLVFLRDAPQGGGAAGVSGHHGFLYHFLEMSSGTRYRESELSSIDTALLMMGVRTCVQYFTGSDGNETSVRTIGDALCERVEWRWFQNGTAGINFGWRPETGFMVDNWRGYNEAIPIFLLALGSSANAVDPADWADWTSTYPQSWGTLQGVEHLYDDGTLTPVAPIASLPFAPELAKPAVAAMYQRYGAAIYGQYGFLDSYNPSFQYSVPLVSGRLVNGLGWVDTRYYGINQGPIVAMIENQRSELLWRLSRTDPVLRRGLTRTGFTGGWLA